MIIKKQVPSYIEGIDFIFQKHEGFAPTLELPNVLLCGVEEMVQLREFITKCLRELNVQSCDEPAIKEFN